MSRTFIAVLDAVTWVASVDKLNPNRWGKNPQAIIVRCRGIWKFRIGPQVSARLGVASQKSPHGRAHHSHQPPQTFDRLVSKGEGFRQIMFHRFSFRIECLLSRRRNRDAPNATVPCGVFEKRSRHATGSALTLLHGSCCSRSIERSSLPQHFFRHATRFCS